MSKTAPQRRSQIARVLQFFREGNRDEVRAVMMLLAEEGLIQTAPRVKWGRKPRLNGGISSQHTDLSQSEAFKSREVSA